MKIVYMAACGLFTANLIGCGGAASNGSTSSGSIGSTSGSPSNPGNPTTVKPNPRYPAPSSSSSSGQSSSTSSSSSSSSSGIISRDAFICPASKSFLATVFDPLSTFAIDVDTASYDIFIARPAKVALYPTQIVYALKNTSIILNTNTPPQRWMR